ncbi:MAG: family 78 glycoside hydrolase catalytic domain [Armatimonadota bacterium]
MTDKRSWDGRWIWVPDIPATEPNTYAYFRKTFTLDEVPEEAIIDISADSKYVLVVNGIYICRGVPMCDPLYQYYDSADIADCLNVGKNVISVLVHHYGVSTSKYMFSGCSGLLFEAQIGDMVIKSDETVKCIKSSAWKQEVPRICATHMIQGFQEHYDMRLEPENWTSSDFDDSSWKDAIVIGQKDRNTPPMDPWPSLVPRDIPHYFEEYRPAESIYRVGVVKDEQMPEDNDLSAKMQAEKIQSADKDYVINPDCMLSDEDDYTEIIQPDDSSTCPTIIVDFGKEVTGMPYIAIEGNEGCIVDIALAELPTKDGINHYWGNLIGMGVAHRVILADRKGPQIFQTFERYGFRYMQITIRNIKESMKIHNVCLQFTSYDVGNRGSFKCDDELLNKIWETGAYTTQLCMYDGWEDCPGREQRQWVGDARVEALINYACFGDFALTRKFLVQIGQSQRPDGMTMCLYPGCAGIINSTISDYNLHWICAIEEYYLYSGDISIIEELYPKIKLSIKYWENKLNEEYLLENVPSHIYIDACILGIDKRGIITTLNCFFVSVLESAARMAYVMNDTDYADYLHYISTQIRDAVNENLFDEEKGIYSDCFAEGKLSDRCSQHSNLLPILYDMVDSSKIDSVWEYITNEDRLCHTHIQAQEGKDIAAAQPFFTYFLLEMFSKKGRYDIILNKIRNLWKPMIDAGHGTFWETWNDVRDDVEKGTQSSLCHAWAASPVFHLSSDILGVRPTSPGFVSFDIAPHPCDLKRAEGVFPSVIGDISVSWEITDEGFVCDFSVPEDSTARFIAPYSNAKKVYLDCKPVESYSVINNSITFENILPGLHRIEITI